MLGCLRRPWEAAYLTMARLSPTMRTVLGVEVHWRRRETASFNPYDSATGPHFSPGRDTLEIIRGFLFPRASLALQRIAAAPATRTPSTSLAPPSQ
eukprot:2011533-Heterocapsa_arctica.AAC.1